MPASTNSEPLASNGNHDAVRETFFGDLLPDEVVTRISAYSDLTDLTLRLLHVSSQWRRIAEKALVTNTPWIVEIDSKDVFEPGEARREHTLTIRIDTNIKHDIQVISKRGLIEQALQKCVEEFGPPDLNQNFTFHNRDGTLRSVDKTRIRNSLKTADYAGVVNHFGIGIARTKGSLLRNDTRLMLKINRIFPNAWFIRPESFAKLKDVRNRVAREYGYYFSDAEATSTQGIMTHLLRLKEKNPAAAKKIALTKVLAVEVAIAYMRKRSTCTHHRFSKHSHKNYFGNNRQNEVFKGYRDQRLQLCHSNDPSAAPINEGGNEIGPQQQEIIEIRMLEYFPAVPRRRPTRAARRDGSSWSDSSVSSSSTSSTSSDSLYSLSSSDSDSTSSTLSSYFESYSTSSS